MKSELFHAPLHPPFLGLSHSRKGKDWFRRWDIVRSSLPFIWYSGSSRTRSTILAIRGWLRRGPPQSRHERTPDTTNTLLITVCSASSTFVVAGRLKLIYLSSVLIRTVCLFWLIGQGDCSAGSRLSPACRARPSPWLVRLHAS